MSKRFTAVDGLSAGIVVLLPVLTAALLPSLPPVIPTHFDARGTADGFMAKESGAWIVPVLTAVTFLVVHGIALAVRGASRVRLDASPVGAVAFIIVVLLAELQVTLLYVWTNGIRSIGGVVAALFGAFFVALSFVLPRIRRNPVVGIRTPWTLSSDENWAMTHRFASYTCFGGGVPAFLLGVSGYGVAAFVPLTVAIVAPLVYSYRIAHR